MDRLGNTLYILIVVIGVCVVGITAGILGGEIYAEVQGSQWEPVFGVSLGAIVIWLVIRSFNQRPPRPQP